MRAPLLIPADWPPEVAMLLIDHLENLVDFLWQTYGDRIEFARTPDTELIATVDAQVHLPPPPPDTADEIF